MVSDNAAIITGTLGLYIYGFVCCCSSASLPYLLAILYISQACFVTYQATPNENVVSHPDVALAHTDGTVVVLSLRDESHLQVQRLLGAQNQSTKNKNNTSSLVTLSLIIMNVFFCQSVHHYYMLPRLVLYDQTLHNIIISHNKISIIIHKRKRVQSHNTVW